MSIYFLYRVLKEVSSLLTFKRGRDWKPQTIAPMKCKCVSSLTPKRSKKCLGMRLVCKLTPTKHTLYNSIHYTHKHTHHTLTHSRTHGLAQVWINVSMLECWEGEPSNFHQAQDETEGSWDFHEEEAVKAGSYQRQWCITRGHIHQPGHGPSVSTAAVCTLIQACSTFRLWVSFIQLFTV